MNTLHTKAATRGFSLVEVMIALVVICVGLLGIAKMQALSLASTTISRQRSMAAIEAASLAAAMHANRLYWGNTSSKFALTWTPSAVPPFASPAPGGDPALAAAANAGGTGHGCDAAGAGAQCPYAANNQALAAADLAGWGTALASVLPNPAATVTCGVPLGTGTLPPSCVITIVWSESSVAMTAQEAAQEAAAQAAGTQGKFEKPSYTLYVEP